MDGLTAIRTLRAEEQADSSIRKQAVIALTGNARDQQQKQALASGFDDVVSAFDLASMWT